MSLADQFAGAVACAQFSDLNDLAHKLWKAHAAGHLDDEQAQQLAEQIEAKRPKHGSPPSSFRPAGKSLVSDECFQASAPRGPKAKSDRQKRQRSPDKQASIERRRRLARRSPVPPEMVHEFTTCEHAAITIMIDEIIRRGVCGLCMDAIAAMAGTCRSIVRSAQRKGRALGLLYRTERRRRGQKSLTNLVQIIKPEWRRWCLWIGRRFLRTTGDKDSGSRKSDAVERFREGVGGGKTANPVPRSP